MKEVLDFELSSFEQPFLFVGVRYGNLSLSVTAEGIMVAGTDKPTVALFSVE